MEEGNKTNENNSSGVPSGEERRKLAPPPPVNLPKNDAGATASGPQENIVEKSPPKEEKVVKEVQKTEAVPTQQGSGIGKPETPLEKEAKKIITEMGISDGESEPPASGVVKKGNIEPPSKARRSIRTYESDVQETIKRDRVSLAGIAVAESKKRLKNGLQKVTQVAPQRPKRGLLIAIGVVLLVVGLGALYFVLVPSEETDVPRTPERAPFIFTDSSVEIDLTGLNERRVVGAVEAVLSGRRGALGSMTEIMPVRREFEGAVELSGREFLEALRVSAPSEFLRTLKPEYMFGMYSLKENEPFLILKVTFFDTAFSGMLEWEKSVSDDMPFMVNSSSALKVSRTKMNEEENPIPQGSTTTPTTTPDKNTEDDMIFAFFGDAVIENRDSRVLVDESGNVFMVYSFQDPETLVITTNIETLSEVFDRLTTTRFTQ